MYSDCLNREHVYLELYNLAGNTIAIYVSKQGFCMGEHGLFDKHFMYEEFFCLHHNYVSASKEG